MAEGGSRFEDEVEATTEALRRIKSLCPQMLVIMITAYDDIESVISAMKPGAHDYVVKPIHIDALELSIRNALETIRLSKEVQILQENYLKESMPCFILAGTNIQDVYGYRGYGRSEPRHAGSHCWRDGNGKGTGRQCNPLQKPPFQGPAGSA